MKHLLTPALLLSGLFPAPSAAAPADGQNGLEPVGTAPRGDTAPGGEAEDDWRDGPALQPGVLPAEATPEARELWQTLCAATLVSDEPHVPIQAFDLTFDLRVYNEQGGHEVNGTRFLFRAPNWISSQLSPTNRLMRGPRGDWLVTKNEVVKLDSREMAEDRRQLDDTLNIAHNFLKLTDPARLRLARLALAPAPPCLPPRLVAPAAELQWLEVESPDLRLFRNGSVSRSNWEDPSYTALLGLDAKRHLPQIVLIYETRWKNDLRRALLAKFDTYLPRDGFQIPHDIKTYRLDPQVAEQRFLNRPELDMVLNRQVGSLRPELVEADFVPETAPQK